MTTSKDFRDVVDLLIDARRRITQLEKDIARNKVGTVCDVDPAKGYRVKFDENENGEAKKSPWLPHPEHGGASSSWNPLSLDQAVMVFSPPGDPRKAVLVRAGFAGDFTPPSQALDERVYQFGAAKLLMKADRIVLSVGENTLTITEENITTLVGRSSIIVADKDIATKARRHYFFGKMALGLSYVNPVKEFPDLVKTVTSAAHKVYAALLGEVIPDDD